MRFRPPQLSRLSSYLLVIEGLDGYFTSSLGRKLTGAGVDATNAQESRSHDGCQADDDDDDASDHKSFSDATVIRHRGVDNVGQEMVLGRDWRGFDGGVVAGEGLL